MGYRQKRGAKPEKVSRPRVFPINYSHNLKLFDPDQGGHKVRPLYEIEDG
jgi:hypothetical protein